MKTESLNSQIKNLQDNIHKMNSKVKDISTNTEQKDPAPYTIGNINKKTIRIADIGTNSDGSIAWNDSELNIPAKYKKPPEPQKGYNKHFHTRYAGGALDINSLEIVEYNIDWALSTTHSKHSQQFWGTIPTIKKAQNTKNEEIDKIGNIAFVFDADSAKWGASAFEIDIEKCYFIRRYLEDGEGYKKGDIVKDENGKEMKSKIYNEDATKTSIIWDETNLCWRFYAIFAEFPEVPTP